MQAILHIPHASLLIPDEYREQFLLTQDELHQEAVLLADLFTDELFQDPDKSRTSIAFPVCRLLVDPERFADDQNEPSFRHGMGVIYSRTSGGAPLRRPLSQSERTALLDRFYHPHHASLAEAVTLTLESSGSALVIDCHSFPKKPFPFEPELGHDRPEICLGTDALHTPAWLRDSVTHAFLSHGYAVAWNVPFQGTLVPAAYYQSNPAVYSLMIEVRRDLILDETAERKSSRFEEIRSDVLTAIAAAEAAQARC